MGTHQPIATPEKNGAVWLAGEASGDFIASLVLPEVERRMNGAPQYGVGGPRGGRGAGEGETNGAPPFWATRPRFSACVRAQPSVPSGMAPKWSKGRMIHRARPSTYRSSTAPRVTSRLSEEWLRLSPMTKMEPSGTSTWVACS